MANKDEMEKHTLWLRRGDYAYLRETLPPRQAAHAVRKIVSNFVDKVKVQAAEAANNNPD